MKISHKGFVVFFLTLLSLVTLADEPPQPIDSAATTKSPTVIEPAGERDYRALEERLIMEERILPTAEEVLPPQVLPPLPGSRQRWRSQLPSLDGTRTEFSSADATEQSLQPALPREPRVPQPIATNDVSSQVGETGVDTTTSAAQQQASQIAEPQQQASSGETAGVSQKIDQTAASPASVADVTPADQPEVSAPVPPAVVAQAAEPSSPEQTAQGPSAPAEQPLSAEESATAEVMAEMVSGETAPENMTAEPVLPAGDVLGEEALGEEVVSRQTKPELSAPVAESVAVPELVEKDQVVLEPVAAETLTAEPAATKVQRPQPQSLEPGRYVVQLGAFSSREKMEAYIAKNGLPSAALARHVTLVDGRIWHVMTWGSFANRKTARQQWQQQGYPQIDVWVRSSESLLAVLK